jgi:predicted dithiol-disulfide oxidoreductase (DUF899 family)
MGVTFPNERRITASLANGTPARVRLSELFRPGTGALILYHYMFPRHDSDERRGPSSGPMTELPVYRNRSPAKSRC